MLIGASVAWEFQNGCCYGRTIQALERILNGNKSTALTSLNTRSMVSPTILNGRRSSQISGKRNRMMSASGQHTISKKHQRISEIKTFIALLCPALAKCLPEVYSSVSTPIPIPGPEKISIIAHPRVHCYTGIS